jgi:peptide/nickel transport system permease protein
MISFLIRRLTMALLVAVLVSMIIFLLMRLAPGDPAEAIAIARSGSQTHTPAELAEIRRQERLDAPLPAEYARWLRQALQGDLGRSMVTARRVGPEIMTRLPATIELIAASMVLALLLAIPLGIWAAARKDSFVDRIFSVATAVGVSTPAFWLGYLLILVFAVQLNWLPAAGKSDWRSLVLPVLSIAPGLAAVTARLVRGNMIETLGEKYVRTARAKGLPERVILWRHALPNAIGPVLAVAALQFGLLLEGATVIETVFAWPGIGRLLVNAVLDRDFPVVQGSVLFLAVIFVLANLASDIAQAVIDPRVRQWRPI